MNLNPDKLKHKKHGLAPGTAVYTGVFHHPTVIDVLHYSETHCDEIKDIPHDDVSMHNFLKSNDGVTWVDISGLSDIPLLEKLGKTFNIHPLILEDIVQVKQRPKFAEHTHNLYLTLKMITWNEESNDLDFEHLSFVMTEKMLLTFQERPGGDAFEWVRKRIRGKVGRIRKMKNDYLFFSLMDAVMDGYFLALENFGDKIETLEMQIVNNPQKTYMQDINSLRRELVALRKSILPVREALNALIKNESPMIDGATLPYWRDLYDHVLYCIDLIESYRDFAGGLMEIYLSTLSQRMNEIMKVLTLFSSIFIPLTFLVGVYGMNFDDMPELHWKYGYAVTWIIMIALGFSMSYWFKKKNWL